MDSNVFISHRVYWRNMGRKFKYPSCCIEYFCFNNNDKPWPFCWPSDTITACNILRNKGKSFVPCRQCTQLIINNVDNYLEDHPNIVKDGSFDHLL